MQTKKILLVEPDADFFDKLKECFEGLQCEIAHVVDPNDAVMMFAVEGPSFVVMTMDLPGVDPVSILKGIRDFDAVIPIVIVSSRYTKEMIIEAKKARATDILVKPPDFGRIRNTVCSRLWTTEEMQAMTAAAAGETSPTAALMQDEPQEEFVEAIPKGAEIANVNELVPGMRIARTVVLNDVVYGDKGQTLTQEKIDQLNRMGVSEVCIWIDPKFKKKSAAAALPKALANIQLPGGGKVFAAVKRTQIRVPLSLKGKAGIVNEAGAPEEIDIEIVDMSGGGAAILSKGKISKDSEMLLNFVLSDDIEFKNAKALVRHCTKRGTEAMPFRSGVFFTSVTDKFREDLITRLFKIQQEQRKKDADKRSDIAARRRGR